MKVFASFFKKKRWSFSFARGRPANPARWSFSFARGRPANPARWSF
jgi:hypothetical protein